MAAVIVPSAATLAVPFVNLALKELKSIVEEPTDSLDDMHKALTNGLESLIALQSDRDRKVDLSNIHKDPSHVYVLWKTRVSKIVERVTSLNKDYEEVGNGYFNYKREEILKEIKRALRDLIELIEGCPEEILLDKLPERAIKEATKSIAEYPTLQNSLDDILTLLQSTVVKCVALHGQKGVGKTTIVQNLNNHFCERVGFDIVIFTKVLADEQKTGDPLILQTIADRIKVDREGNDNEVAGIQKRLENKRYLLILDGVRHPVTLDCIWEKLDISNDKKDSKVVITTHYPLVWKSNCVQRKVELKKLSDTEAWKMFQGIVGNSLPKNAQLICKRFCSCLPLLIDHIAKSFKYQEVPVDWQRALDECAPWPQFGVEGLEEVYSYLESLCLKRLRNQGVHKCFLYASLYPANSKICTKYFVECCIAQGFLDDAEVNAKYIEMRRRAIAITLTYLVNVAFLVEEEQMRYVKMDGLYREFALYISSKCSDSKCRTYVDKEEHEVGPDSWQDVRWVSMIGTKRDSLKTNQDCESLQTLLLQKNMELVEIPSNYFESMGELRVLNLYCTKINKLPSLEGLTKLKALYLNGCSELKIGSPEEIKPLKHLEIFDIRDIRMDFVPCLESLLSLRISYIASCDQSGHPDNYHPISMLQKLEELTIEVKSPQEWRTNAECIIGKVASLKNLTFFRCRFHSSETLDKFLEASKSWRDEKLVHFKFKRAGKDLISVKGKTCLFDCDVCDV